MTRKSGRTQERSSTPAEPHSVPEQQYVRSLIEASLDPLVTISPEGKITDVNEATVEVTGVPRQELVGTDFANYFTEPQKAEEGYQRVFSEGFVTDYALTIRHAQGRLTDVLYNASVYKDAAGNVLGVFAAARDVTALNNAQAALKELNATLEQRVTERTAELRTANQALRKEIADRKRAEEARWASEERFRVVQELSPDGFTILRPVRDSEGHVADFTWIYENAAIARMNGTDPKAVVGRRLLDLFPGHRGTEFLKAYQHVAETGETHTFEAQYSGETMHVTWFRIAVVPMNGDIAVLAQDITERKRAEEELRSSEELLRAVTDNTPDAIYVKDSHSRWLMANPALLKIVGKPLDEVYLRTDTEIYSDPAIGMPILAHDAQVLESGEPAAFEERADTPEGVRLFSSTKAPRRDAQGKIIGLVGISSDITERKRSQEQLAANLDAMTRLQKLGAVFVREGNLEPVLGEIVEVAVAIARADFGNIQLLDEPSRELRMVAQRGFPQWWVDFWSSVPAGTGVCGTALARGERVIVEDVEHSPVFACTPALEVQLKAGVRAVQSTPLVSRSGKLLGMFSTHYKAPCRPDEDALRLLDLLARQAADIIERTQAEAALRRSEARYRMLHESLRDPFVQVSMDGRIIDFNDLYCQMIGYSAEEIRRLTYKQLTPERWHAFEDRIVREQVIPHGYSDVYEKEYQKKDGTIIPVELRTILSRDASGRCESMWAIVRDITERNRAEETLRASEERFRLSMEATSDGLWDWNATTDEVYYSPAYYRILGYDVGDFPGTLQAWKERVHPDDLERAVQVNTDCVEGRSDSFAVEYRMKARDGQWRWILGRGKCITRDAQGRATRLIGTHVDITGRKYAEEAMIRSEKLASVGRMAATIAHEINNPLAAVMNSVFIAQTNADSPEKVRPALDLADEELRRVAHLTRQTLGFYRESSIPAPMSVNGVLESSIDLLKSKIRDKQANLQRHYAAEVEIIAVSGELRQVFSNVLSNSLDAIAHGGNISVSVSRSEAIAGDRHVTVIVADDGPGIKPDVLAHIFEPFFTTKEAVGTGLGLWVAKQLVEKHGGSISVESITEGQQRTTFSIVLPVNTGTVNAPDSNLTPARAKAATAD